MQNLALSLAVIAAFICIAAGIWGLYKGHLARTKALLMIAVGFVLLGNAWLWATMPRVQGQLPSAATLEAAQP